MKKVVWFFALLFLTVIDVSADPNMAATDSLLLFSDITSGPQTGNSDTSSGRTGQDGAIVTIWGRNLGSAQSDSRVYVNDAEAASYYFWGNATNPADLYTYHGLQMISLQVSHLSQDGAGQIYVVVNGKQSNSLPFTVRSGNIYFATIAGHDDTGDGSWGNPWRSIAFTADSLAPGDIAYIGDGVDQTVETEFSAAVNLGSDGTPANPKALVVYPGATSNVGNANLERAFHVWNRDTSTYSVHWVVAKFRMTTAGIGVTAQSGFRVVGNYVTAPNGDGLDGAIGGIGNDIYILGNELENVGSLNCSKLYHAIYISGVRQDTGPRAPTESNREVAWNYVHDCQSNRAVNIYSEQDYSAFIQQHRIHDNAIVNQRGDGIMIGYYVTGENWIYNNLVVNAGLGPEWVDDPSYHIGLRINTGHEAVTQTVVYVYNNTLYGNGWSGAALPDESGSLLVDQGSLDRSTMLYFTNNILYSTGEPYVAGESAPLPWSDYRNCFYGNGPAPEWDTTALNDDPKFVNVGGFDFQLQASSPCVDAGKNVSAVVARDVLGVPRPQGLAYDIGAYEYIPRNLFNTVSIATNLTAPPTVGNEVGITLTATMHTNVFYRWYARAGFGTQNPGNWQALEADWSTSNSIVWTPESDNRHVVLAWIGDATNRTSRYQAGLTFETEGNSLSPIQITGMTTDMIYPQPSGIPINLATTAAGGSGPIYFKYFYKPEHGSWTALGAWSTSSSATWTPSQDGLYTIVVHISDDESVSSNPFNQAGMTCTIGD